MKRFFVAFSLLVCLSGRSQELLEVASFFDDLSVNTPFVSCGTFDLLFSASQPGAGTATTGNNDATGVALIVLSVYSPDASPTGPITVSSSPANTWVAGPSVPTGASGFSNQQFQCISPTTSAAMNFTATCSGGGNVIISVHAFTCTGTPVFIGTSTNSYTSVSLAHNASLTPSGTNLFVSSIGLDSGNAGGYQGLGIKNVDGTQGWTNSASAWTSDWSMNNAVAVSMSMMMFGSSGCSGGGGGDINTALTHHYKFDENTGLTTVDSVGGVSYLGTFHGVGNVTSWAPAKIGVSSVAFESGSSSAGVVPATSITMPNDCTYANWIWLTNDANGSYQADISQDGSHGLYFHGSGGGVGKMDYFYGSDHFTATTIPTNTWSHVVLTISNTVTARIYINGVMDGNSPFTVTGPINVVGFGSDAGTGAEGLRGRLDDDLTYSRVLQQLDITTLYNSTTGPTP